MNNQSESDAEAARWLGRLQQANHLVAFMEPIARWVDGDWLEVESAAASKQRVNVRPAELGTNKAPGSVWVFDLNTKSGQIERKLASHPIRALPLIDMSDLNLADARRELTEIGVRLPPHQGRQALVLLPGQKYAEIKFEKQGALWIAKPPDGLVHVFECEPSWRKPKAVKGFVYLPSEPIQGKRIQTLDWSSPSEFLSRVIKRYRTVMEAYSKAQTASGESLVRRLEQALSGVRQKPTGNGEDLTGFAERLREEWPNLSANLGAIEEFGHFLLGSDEAKRLLDAALDRRKQQIEAELEASARGELERQFAHVRKELSQLRLEKDRHADQILNLRQELQQAEIRLENTRAEALIAEKNVARRHMDLEEIQAQVDVARRDLAKAEESTRNTIELEKAHKFSADACRAALEHFLRRLRDQIEAAGSEEVPGMASLAERLRGVLDQTGQGIAPLLPSAAPPWWAPGSADVPEICVQDISKKLAEEADRHGLAKEDLRLVDGFARAGEPVFLLGDCAELACDAYARTVSGGKVRRYMVDPSVLGVDDLWRTAASGRPTAFALAWHRAAVNPQETVLACLCAIDAAPMHLWLGQLSDVLRSAERPRNLLVLATASGSRAGVETFEHASSLASRFVLISPRTAVDVQIGVVALQPLPTAVKLRWSDAEDGVPTKDLLEVAGRAKALMPLRRAMHLRSRLEESGFKDAQHVALAWSTFLESKASEALPVAMSIGLKVAESLHLQR